MPTKFSHPPLKGVNLGGWLLMEGYLLGGRIIAETTFKKDFKKHLGAKALEEFETLFRNNFIQKKDFQNIAAMGATVVRVPFNYRLIETAPFKYSPQGLRHLKNVFTWAQQYQIKVILDLHAACGAQNYDWHGDNTTGRAGLWENERCRQRTYALWQMLAATFKDEPALYAYDVLNEPVLESAPVSILCELYQNIITKIRSVDSNTLIYLEGHLWSQKIDFLKDLVGDKIGVSFHFYHPLNYAMNFTPYLQYPGRIEGAMWNKNTLRKIVKPYYDFAQKYKVKMFAGEFGINWQGGHYGETQWLDDVLTLFDECQFDYTYWTYKAVANPVLPDGIYQQIPENKYICRMGPVYGFETYKNYWKAEKNQIADFWLTKNFTPNKPIINMLRKKWCRFS